MSFSFAFTSKSQPTRRKHAASAVLADDPPPFSTAAGNYIREFDPAEAPPQTEPKVKPIAPIPNEWPTKKLKNLPNLHLLSQSNGSDSSLQFEVDARTNSEAADNSMAYGLNIRQAPAADDHGGAIISDLKLRRLREDLEKLPEDAGMDDFTDVPVEGFGLALLSGYGWKDGMGIGSYAKEDVKVSEVMKRTGRGGLGFTEEFSENRIDSNSKGAADLGNENV